VKAIEWTANQSYLREPNLHAFTNILFYLGSVS